MLNENRSSEVFFRQSSNTGSFYQQGNDIPGTLRLVKTDGTYLDIVGAINWRGPSGSIQYFGFIPSPTSPSYTLSYNGQPYVIDSGSNYALIKNDSSFTFANDSNLTGNAATTGLLDSLNSYLATSQANAPLGPVTVNSQSTTNTTPTVTGTVTLQTGDTLSVFINGIEYNTSNGLIVSGGTWSIAIPPSDALSPGVYSVDAVITNTQGYTLADSSQSELVILSNTPAISVKKTASTTAITSPVAGTTQVTYTIEATNTGAVTLTSVSAADTLTGGTSHNLTPVRTGGNAGDTSFDPGDTFTWSVSYTLDQSDINAGAIENVASVSGTPSGGGSAITVYSGADGTASTSSTPPAPGSGVVTTITATAGFSVKKTASTTAITSPVAGTTQVTYTIEATNTGAVTLTSVSAADTLTGGTSHNLTPVRTGGNAGDTSFDPGDTFTWSVSYTLDQSDINAGAIENVASVSGTPSGGGSAITVYSGADGTASTSSTPPSSGSGVVTTIRKSAQDAFEEKEDDARATIQRQTIDQLSVAMRNSERMMIGARDRMISRFTICRPVERVISLVMTSTPELELRAGKVLVGDNIRLSLTVVNSGTDVLRDISVKSDQIRVSGGPLAELQPGASDSHSFSAEYTITHADLVRGYVRLSAITSAQAKASGRAVGDRSGTHIDNDEQLLIRLGTQAASIDPLAYEASFRCHGVSDDGVNTPQSGGRVPFDVNGTVDAGYDASGVDVAAKGDFQGQTGFNNGVNYGITGTFDVLFGEGQGEMVAFDARIVREQFVHRDTMVGGFLGVDLTSGDVPGTYGFDGDFQGLSLFGGGYVIGRLSQNLYAEGFASLGYGWNNLSMKTDIGADSRLTLNGDYGAMLWQLGGSLTGVFEVESFELRPSLTAVYGSALLGNIGLTAKAYGDTDVVSLDAGSVALGTLRLTPEIRMAIEDATDDPRVSALSLRPSVVCEYAVSADDIAACGLGIGVGYAAPVLDGSGVLELEADFESLGGQQLIGGRAEFSVRF